MAIRWFDLPNNDWVQLMAKLRGLATSMTNFVALDTHVLTASQTMTLTKPHTIVLVNADAGDVTVTLPPAEDVPGYVVYVKKITVPNNARVTAPFIVDGAIIAWSTRYQSYTFVAVPVEGWMIV